MSSSAAYMREYRARLGGLTAHERARLMAVDWVREHRPDLWAGMLEQANEDIKIAADSLQRRPGRRASTPQPAGASNTAEVALPQSSGADPLPPRSLLGTTPHRVVTADGLSAASHPALPVGLEVS